MAALEVEHVKNVVDQLQLLDGHQTRRACGGREDASRSARDLLESCKKRPEVGLVAVDETKEGGVPIPWKTSCTCCAARACLACRRCTADGVAAQAATSSGRSSVSCSSKRAR